MNLTNTAKIGYLIFDIKISPSLSRPVFAYQSISVKQTANLYLTLFILILIIINFWMVFDEFTRSLHGIIRSSQISIAQHVDHRLHVCIYSTKLALYWSIHSFLRRTILKRTYRKTYVDLKGGIKDPLYCYLCAFIYSWLCCKVCVCFSFILFFFENVHTAFFLISFTSAFYYRYWLLLFIKSIKESLSKLKVCLITTCWGG